jgi:GNAT superfamily N-acetyltransferase
MSYTVKIRECIPSVEEYQRLRDSVNWSKVSDRAVKNSLENSLFSICAFLNSKLIGYGRIIGDRGIYYYIQDMMVLPIYQKRGIGKQIMNELIEYLNNHADESAFIGLMAAKGYSQFYEPYGFIRRSDDSPGMFKYNQP